MKRLFAFILAGCLSLVVAGCGPTPTPTLLPAAPASPTAIPSPAPAPPPPTPSLSLRPTPVASQATALLPTPASSATPPSRSSSTPVARTTGQFVERPLGELAPQAVDFLARREGPRGVAVVVPSHGVIYTENGDELTPMASVAKVTIMITVMDQAIKQNRPLTEWELTMIRPMITVSDNDTATALWEYVGGGAAVSETLRSMGLTRTEPNPAEAWGASRSTPKEVALLLAKLLLGEVLDQPMRDLSLELMGAVAPEQTWGVTSGVPTDRPLQAAIAIKDGWLPTKGGWWVNSAGIIMPLSDQPAYVMAVLTRQQPTLDYGIATIEGVAERVHHALHVQPTPTR